ncbi:Ca2+ sensor, putative [Ixodes scapularis]|uniref:Ca2+ sensor, putative n=1 Tax=Ixodes scapularis TaxID=6945 RepID=B7P3D5_IXOSC|nr:Ca2+ sensor, putative [Ixodes scapularis]|eukprot:XP_002403920.1 Ca2+ sensor, putative [Ixodes scapularis]
MGSKQSKLKPKVLQDLQNNTDFTEDEIKKWYKCFMKDSPSGRISVDEFKKLYCRYFPLGDASKFAENVFRTFATDKNGYMDFREFMCGLHVTSRGTPDEKIAWAFSMYDLDGDGFIEKHEMIEMIAAVHKMVGFPTKRLTDDELTPEQRTEKIFLKMDKNNDGKLSVDEFLEGARQDPSVVRLVLGDHKFECK